jgi:predicted amidohydrolase
MNPFAIAGVQLHTSAVQSNLPAMERRLDLTMHLYPWVQMVVFSELAALGPLTHHAQPLPGPTEETFREWAHRYRIWLVPGSIFERLGDKIYNTAMVINPMGEVVARYRKMFPFLPYEQGIEPGTEFCIFDIPQVGRFGVSICYDMWFPETSRTLAAMGAEVIIHPTMTTTIDRDVELAIAQSTAAVNQCFMFDINGAGDGGNGRSIVVGPMGDVMYTAGHSEEVIPLEIDLDRARRSREVGLRGLGQPLKSFRDRRVRFTVYDKPSGYLATLGPLVKPERGVRPGMKAPAEAVAEREAQVDLFAVPPPVDPFITPEPILPEIPAVAPIPQEPVDKAVAEAGLLAEIPPTEANAL